ncbi:MAG: hypothetical protein WCI06_02065 [Methylococcaceae bacterium]
MTEITLELENSADETLLFALLQRMGIAFSAFKKERDTDTKKIIVQNDYSDFKKASESVLNDIWNNADDAEYDRL